MVDDKIEKALKPFEDRLATLEKMKTHGTSSNDDFLPSGPQKITLRIMPKVYFKRKHHPHRTFLPRHKFHVYQMYLPY